MAGYLTPIGKATLLNFLASEATYLGLAQTLGIDTPVELASISEVVTPGYARVGVTWSTASEANGFLNNPSSAQFGPVTQDMPPAGYAFLTNAASGSAISAPVLTLGSAGAGSFSAGTYYWVVTAVNSKGETVASNEISATLTDSAGQSFSWTAPTTTTAGTAYNVSGYNIYRGTAQGQETTLAGSVGSGTLAFTDSGAAGTTQSPPIFNTASVGDIFYIWEIAEPVSALANKPIYVPATGLIIE